MTKEAGSNNAYNELSDFARVLVDQYEDYRAQLDQNHDPASGREPFSVIFSVFQQMISRHCQVEYSMLMDTTGRDAQGKQVARDGLVTVIKKQNAAIVAHLAANYGPGTRDDLPTTKEQYECALNVGDKDFDKMLLVLEGMEVQCDIIKNNLAAWKDVYFFYFKKHWTPYIEQNVSTNTTAAKERAARLADRFAA